MRKIKEVLRLRHELGLGQRQIARSCSIAQSTVHQYLKAAETAGVKWPLPSEWDESQLEEALFGGRPEPPSRRSYPAPDFAAIHQELQTHSHLTLELLWEEYRQANAAGAAYRYSRFCELYQRWHRHLDVVQRQEHRPHSHQQHLAWPPSRLLDWAKSVGPSAARLFEQIFNGKPHPEMGYRSCLGIMRLAKQYSGERVEAAAARALRLDVCSYRSVKSMLERGLDRQPLEAADPPRPPLEHANIRGPHYFDPLHPDGCPSGLPSGTNPSTLQ